MFAHLLIFLVVIIFFNYVFVSCNGFNMTRDQINKYDIINYINTTKIGEKYSLETLKINKNSEFNILENIEYPVIMKPTKCAGGGNSVKKINTPTEAKKYIYKNGTKDIIIQEYHRGPFEVGLLFERNPITKKPKIVSVVHKKGSSIKCGNGCKCGCIDITDKITPELENIIFGIMEVFPNFCRGRFDIRCENLEEFFKGKNFKIVELNGCMSFDLRLHTNKHKLSNYYLLLEMVSKNIFFGIVNILKGNGQCPILYLKSIRNKFEDYSTCHDLEIFFSDWD